MQRVNAVLALSLRGRISGLKCLISHTPFGTCRGLGKFQDLVARKLPSWQSSLRRGKGVLWVQSISTLHNRPRVTCCRASPRNQVSQQESQQHCQPGGMSSCTFLPTSA